jgi:hypothetical protein
MVWEIQDISVSQNVSMNKVRETRSITYVFIIFLKINFIFLGTIRDIRNRNYILIFI